MENKKIVYRNVEISISTSGPIAEEDNRYSIAHCIVSIDYGSHRVAHLDKEIFPPGKPIYYSSREMAEQAAKKAAKEWVDNKIDGK